MTEAEFGWREAEMRDIIWVKSLFSGISTKCQLNKIRILDAEGDSDIVIVKNWILRNPQ